MPIVLVTGKNGQLGSELQLVADRYPGYEFIFTDRLQLDIQNLEDVSRFFQHNKIDFCVNAAAYTAVDKAETDKETALLINAIAVENLAIQCVKYNCQFIHISTDYVYDGSANTPYIESHQTNPVNYYGFTKLQGELLAQQRDPTAIIIRTSWVYSSFGNNFVKTMMRLTSKRSSINVVSDQVGSPTYAADLANAILQIINETQVRGKVFGGVYHFSNDGIISWYEFAKEICNIAQNNCLINPIPSSGFPLPAPRPAYSALDKSKITRTFNLQLKHWKESLLECLRESDFAL